jgi:hypothetical protein
VVRGGSCESGRVFVAHANLRDPFSQLYRQNLRFSHIGFAPERCGAGLGVGCRALGGTAAAGHRR